MPHPFAPVLLGGLLIVAAAAPARAQVGAGEVILTPSQDNTLYEDLDDRHRSNGAGSHLFTGRTVQNSLSLRRALLAFDVAGALPPGARVEAVELTLTMTRTASFSGVHDVGLHRLLEAWGEGASDTPGQEGGGVLAEPGDATWHFRRFDAERWQTPGGHFEAAPSAVLPVGAEGSYTWPSTPALVADVQGWLDDPDGGFGWILVGDEAQEGSAKRFASRENETLKDRPRLRVRYTTGTGTDAEALDIHPAVSVLPAAPNPFRTATTLTVVLPRPDHVLARVVDAAGREVARLADGRLDAGSHALTLPADGLPSGVYVVHVATSEGVATRRVVLVR